MVDDNWYISLSLANNFYKDTFIQTFLLSNLKKHTSWNGILCSKLFTDIDIDGQDNVGHQSPKIAVWRL